MFDHPSDDLSCYTESEIINKIKAWLGTTTGLSPMGIGDDCAVFTPVPKQEYLVSTDALVYGEHFDSSISAQKAGNKLTLRNLSDIAAMGGQPKHATISIISSSKLSIKWLSDFFAGIKETSDQYGLKIVGGDLCHLEGPQFHAVMNIIGSSPRPILRNRALAKDRIYVTGTLGGSILEKHYCFKPHLSAGQWLSSESLASSMVDITDGIAKELPFLLSDNTSASINLDNIPISDAAWHLSNQNKQIALKKAFCDGEDYELLFTLNSNADHPKFETQWSSRFPNVKLTQIGTIVPSQGADLIIDQSTQKPIDWILGFDHFKT